MPFALHELTLALNRPPRHLDCSRYRCAAVSAIFAPPRDLLFIRRADLEGDYWSGQVAFPGGKQDPGDATLLDAAIRETYEEIGLQLGPKQQVGTLDDLVVVTVPDMMIRPFVFALDHRPTLSLNDEVASIHWLDMDRLLTGKGRGTMFFETNHQRYTLPCVDFDGQRLWGLTLSIVDGLLDRLDGGGLGLDRQRPSDNTHR